MVMLSGKGGREGYGGSLVVTRGGGVGSSQMGRKEPSIQECRTVMVSIVQMWQQAARGVFVNRRCLCSCRDERRGGRVKLSPEVGNVAAID